VVAHEFSKKVNYSCASLLFSWRTTFSRGEREFGIYF
jgi:hypothetical protein